MEIVMEVTLESGILYLSLNMEMYMKIGEKSVCKLLERKGNYMVGYLSLR